MSPPVRVLQLPALHEYRFELDPGEALSITLLSGTAEVFGFELTTGQPHPFGSEVRAAVWSSNGAEIEITGRATTDYIASESPLPAYLALHLALTTLRLKSRPSSNAAEDLSLPDDEVLSPRVMVVGEQGAGKTSLVKTLVNWRVREMKAKGGKTGVVVVNLDVAEGAMSLPGTLSLVAINALLPTTTPISPFGISLSSGPPVPFPVPTTTDSNSTEFHPPANVDTYSPPVNPLLFWHGYTLPSGNAPLYDVLLKSVGRVLDRKLQEGGLEGWKAGCIVDTPGEWAEKKGMPGVLKAVRELSINVLLVVGNERLYVEMSKLMSLNKTVKVVRVPKSDGASEPDLSYQAKIKDQQIRSYFYGGPALSQGVLSPFSIIVKFDDLKICRVGEAAGTQAPSSALPIGFARSVSDTELMPLDLELPKSSTEILHRILAVPQASDDDGDEAIVAGPALGFVYVSAIDVLKKKVTLLSPLPGRLPRKTLLLASLDWQDS